MIMPFAAIPAAVSRTLVKVGITGAGAKFSASIRETAMQNARVNGPRPRWPMRAMARQRHNAEQSSATPVRAAACQTFCVAASATSVHASTAMPEMASATTAGIPDDASR